MRISVIVAKILIVISLLIFAPKIQSNNLGQLTVKIIGLRNDKGNVGLTLFNQAKGFPEDSNLSHRQAQKLLTSAYVEFKIDNLAYGTYGIGVIHDENNNNKMDTNFLGIPREGFGISNNPKVIISAPSFEDAKFKFDQNNQTIIIRIKYF